MRRTNNDMFRQLEELTIEQDGILKTAEKATYLAYIRTYSNKDTTVLTASSNKTDDSVVSDNILTQFHGIVAQEHEAKFYHYGD